MRTIGRILALFEVWLARPFAPLVIMVMSAAILVSSLRQGRTLDDFVLVAASEQADIVLGRAPADLFVGANGNAEDAERLRSSRLRALPLRARPRRPEPRVDALGQGRLHGPSRRPP
jgi:hypothetical protein